jgi:hypothetical protein
MPGGANRRSVLETDDIWAIAAPMSVPGWKNTFIRNYAAVLPF